VTQDLSNLVAQARDGNERAAARLMTTMTDQPHRLAEMLSGSRDWPTPRIVLGITGAPGSGKSTLTDQVATEYRNRYPDRRLGIIAVDPSSPFTGGAVLGDRVRMMRHATDPKVFIRSLASRGHLGGLALGARGVSRVMGLIGCDTVLIETVGVGQSEVEIAQNADIVAVVLAPGQGDSIQMLKAGLMEAGDLFVVNKADREGAHALHQQLLASLQLSWTASVDLHHDALACHGVMKQIKSPLATGPEHVRGAAPPVYLTSAANGTGITELVDGLEAITQQMQEVWRIRRLEQLEDELRESLFETVRRRVGQAMGTNGKAQVRLRRVLDGQATIDDLADELLNQIVKEQTHVR
jgi:LAO/AO transport system kinase